MLKAGALLYVIFISIIMTIIIGLLITLDYYKSIEIADYSTIEKLNRNVTSGLNILMAGHDVYKKDSIAMELFGSTEDSVILISDSWGFFRKYFVSATKNRFTSSKAILAGIWNKSHPALVLGNSNTALSLAGSTFIYGPCYLPNMNITNSYIENQKFTGLVPPKEMIHSINSIKPRIDKKYLEFIFDQNNISNLSNYYTNWESYLDSLNISNEFKNKTIVFFLDKNLILTNKTISGNIKIVSSKSIYVKSDCILSDIILIAPKIEIEKSFNGTLQCIATDTIIVGENTKLEYPSILSIIRNNKTNNNALIKLQGMDSIFGDIVIYDKYESANKFNCISLKKKSFVHGQIYSSGFTEANCTVFGSVYTNKLTVRTTSSIYDNILFDCLLDVNRISPFYLSGCQMLGEHMKILKYLN